MNRSNLPNSLTILTATLVTAVLSACGGGASSQPTSVGTAATATISLQNSGSSINSKPIASSTTVYTTSFCGIANFDASMLAAVNAARAVARICGDTAMPAVPALTSDVKLISAASRHSLDMAKTLNFGHTGSDNSSFSERITAAGYVWSDAGENVALNQRSIPDVIDSWLKSPGHCANIMGATRPDFGSACEKSSDGSFYWTQLFATPL